MRAERESPSMRVRARLFAGARDAIGASHVEVDLPEGARVADLVAALAGAHPRFAPYREHLLFAVDGAFVTPQTRLSPGAEVALMPPVSGGSGAIDAAPFSLDELVARLERDGAGAVVAFVGLVRATSGERPGARVERLAFEAHAPLAERAIEEIRQEAIAKFQLSGCLVRHRIGTLAVGEPIVAVAAAAPHRRAAFEAATWVMDELKARVPIWKQEQGPAGAFWVNDPSR